MSNLLDALAAMYANQAPDEGAWRDKFIQDHQDWPDLYKSPNFAGRFGGAFRPTENDVRRGTIADMLMRYGLEIGPRESANVRDLTQSVSMNPLQAVRDLYQSQQHTNALGRYLLPPF